jgi:hypothetical protein
MGEILIKGFGKVQIAGDEPTEAELNDIKTFLSQNKDLINSDANINQQTDELIKGPNWSRLVLEVGGSIAGSFFTGGLALPLMAARVGMISKPFLAALLKSSAGSFGGGASGSLVSETFDPTDHAFKTAIKAGTAGFVGEAIGAPLGIGIFNQVGRIMRPALKEHDVVARGEAILSGKIDDINSHVKKFGYDDAVATYGTNLVEAAKVARITPGVRYDNRFIDMLENLSERSIFGGASLIAAKQGTRDVAESIIYDFNSQLAALARRGDVSEGIFRTGDDVGNVFINALSGSNATFKKAAGDNYDLLLKEYDKITKQKLRDVPVPRGEEEFVGGASTIKQSVFDLDNKIIDTKDVLRSLEDFESVSKAIFPNAQDALSKIKSNITFLKNNPKLSLREVIDLKKGINDAMPPITVANKNAYNEVAKKLRDAGRQLIQGSKDLPKEFKAAASNADDFFSKGNEFFNNATIQSIAKNLKPNYLGQLEGNGSKVVNEILNHKHPGIMRKMLEALEDGKTKGYVTEDTISNLKIGLKSKLFNDLIESSQKQKGIYNEAFDPDTMLKNFKDRKSSFEQLFTKTELKTMNDNISALRLAYGKIADEGSLPGGVAITLAQPGALASLAFGGGVTVSAGVLLAGPYAIAKAFTNKSVAKYLQKSFKTIQEEAVASHKAAGAGNFAGISNFRKTSTSLRQLSEQLLANRLIDESTKEAFDKNIPFAIDEIRKNIEISNKQPKQPLVIQPDKQSLEPDPIDKAIDSFIEPQSMTVPQTTQPAPQPRVRPSGIASLQSRPEQLARLDQLGLSLFDRG